MGSIQAFSIPYETVRKGQFQHRPLLLKLAKNS